MEIWTMRQVSSNPPRVWWRKSIFKAGGNLVPCFFKQQVSLISLIANELRRGEKGRWIVFSEKEERNLEKMATLLVYPSGIKGADLLDCLFHQIRRGWGGGFSATYIRENNPNLSPNADGAILRLAIQIDDI